MGLNIWKERRRNQTKLIFSVLIEEEEERKMCMERSPEMKYEYTLLCDVCVGKDDRKLGI